MCRKGNGWNNAPMESFFGTPKTERLHHCHFETHEQPRQVVFEYVEVFYNRIRRHKKLATKCLLNSLTSTTAAGNMLLRDREDSPLH